MKAKDFANVIYLVLPTIAQMLHAAESEGSPAFSKQRCEDLLVAFDEAILAFAKANETLRINEVVCALMLLASYVAETQILNQPGVEKMIDGADAKVLAEMLANTPVTGRPN